jgi:GABA permease
MSLRRYLVVANQTLGGPELTQKLEECVAAGPCRFRFVVPATSVSDMELDRPLTLSGVDGGAGLLPDIDEMARAMARRRLEKELARLRAAGVDAEGEVGDPRPLHAIKDVLRKQEVDEVIVSTLHHGSRWLLMDLPHRVRRSFQLPVTHVAGHAGAED